MGPVRRLAPTDAAAAARAAAACASAPAARTAPGTLDIYLVDVEGGKAVLARTPRGTSILLDAGFPGDGTFESKPGPPAQARDAQRILAAARDARIDHIDYFISSHYHADHLGGVLELAQLIPIGTFVDHAAPTAEAERVVPGTQALYEAYVALRSKGKHVRPAAGDRITIDGDVQAIVVAIDSAVLPTPLAGGGQPNAACTGTGAPAQEATENPRSLAVVLQFGRFRFLDPGDLSGAPLHALACPVDRIGPVDAYVVAHHGGNDGADRALFAATRPLVAVTTNGPRKGAQARTLETIASLAGVEGWQLHRTVNRDARNVPDERIANLDTTTAAWLKLSASADGSFTVTNGRTGQSRSYRR